MSIQSFRAICDFCGHENHITVATISTLHGSQVDCPVCGAELGRFADTSSAKQDHNLSPALDCDAEPANLLAS
jgi:transcription elongation factor Elf1